MNRARIAAHRISRRAFIGGAVIAGGAIAAGSIIGARRHGGGDAPAADRRERVLSRGGVLRAYDFAAMPEDSLDPHLTRIGPVVDMHSAVFSRVLRYADEHAGAIAPDLAREMPERPDALTYVIRLRDEARFHDTAPLRLAHPAAAGRAVRADDVKYSIERQLDHNSPQARRFSRATDWSVIDTIDVHDDATLTLRLKQPVAPFLDFLAGRHAFILPRGLADDRDEAKRDLDMVGSGPFMLDAWQPGSLMRLVRNPSWHGANDDPTTGVGRPFIDAYDAYYSPQEDVFQQVVFEHERIDLTSFTDPAALGLEHGTNLADIALEETRSATLLASRLLLDRAPFKDDRARRAMHLAVDRAALIAAIYPPLDGQPSAELSGPIPPGVTRWALAPEDLAKRPGYRSDPAGRAEDLQAAKQLWSAALGDVAAPEVRILCAGAPRWIFEKAAPLVASQLRDALGVSVTPVRDDSGIALLSSALQRNLDGATEGVVPFTLALEDGGADLDEWLYAPFRSGASQNTSRLQDATLDAMLDRSRAETDFEARHTLGRDMQDYLLANANARIEYFAPVERRLAWGYVRNSRLPLAPGALQYLADVWLDTTHGAWPARPS
ncbi:MAG TPA: ABC transporter substrate-binding protein [Dehalococcoidia bacterium]|nr:ABC transporter substrate-binding protein [Dehalococcoidia bacterium]